MDRQNSELHRWQLVKVGAYEQALPLFQQQALSADARGPDLGNLGILYLLLRAYRLALSCFTQAAERTEQHLATDAGLIAQGICYGLLACDLTVQRWQAVADCWDGNTSGTRRSTGVPHGPVWLLLEACGCVV